MSETPQNNFHEFSLKSSLFKGRPDLYFCYLKSEKLAHALARLLPEADGGTPGVADTLLRSSAYLPAAVVRFAAGEFEESSVLVDVFELLSLVRISVSHGFISEPNATILMGEYEAIAEKIALGKNASPFLSLDDFAVPPFAAPEPGKALLPTATPPRVSMEVKGQDKGQARTMSPEQRERTANILKIIIERKRVSIKDISKVIKNCSEKTIQRELNMLIQQGLIRKEGERRWSVYVVVEGLGGRD